MKISVLQRMLLLILAPAVLCLVGVASMNYLSSKSMMEKQLHASLGLAARAASSEIDTHVSMLENILTNFALSPGVYDLLGGSTAKGNGRQEHLALAARASAALARDFTVLSGAGVVSMDGTVLAHTSPSFIGTSLSDRGYIRQALAGGRGSMTIVSRSTNKLTSTMAVPVRDGSRQVGVVYCTLDIEQIAKRTIDMVKMSETGFAMVFDSGGTTVMHPDRKQLGSTNEQSPFIREIADSSEQSGMRRYGRNGVSYTGYFVKIPQMGWTVLVNMAEPDMFAPVIRAGYSDAAVTSLAVILLIGLIVHTSRSIVLPLRGIGGIVQKVASGTLTLNADEQRELDRACARADIIGTLACGMSEMLVELTKQIQRAEQKTAEAEQAVSEALKAAAEAESFRVAAEKAKREGMLAAAAHLAEAVEAIKSAVDQLSARIRQSERGAEEQATRMGETAHAMDQMNMAVLDVARNAGEASKASALTRDKAEQGSEVVARAVQGIQQVQQESLVLKADMETLSEHAKSISRIMGVISDIADQTNLLALNAAIEAARAGDAGRGFAVVADEVRKLAEKTMASTSDVSSSIQAIQHSVAQSMGQVDKAVKNVEQATVYARQSGEALQEIVGMVELSADQVHAIATAGEEQSATSEAINQSIGKVNAIAEESAEAMHQAAGAVAELTRQSELLQQLIVDMKQA